MTTLGRRPVASTSPKLDQHVVDVLAPESYRALLADHDAAVCTLGVGEPSKVSREEFVRIDHDSVLAFATACRGAGVRHFELLSSVGVDSRSSAFYLKTKGQLEDRIRALELPRTSFFHPSMILTPENRYGVGQAITLAVWPRIDWMFVGRSNKLRGIRVDVLGRAMATNLFTPPPSGGVEVLEWAELQEL